MFFLMYVSADTYSTEAVVLWLPAEKRHVRADFKQETSTFPFHYSCCTLSPIICLIVTLLLSKMQRLVRNCAHFGHFLFARLCKINGTLSYLISLK